MKKIILLLFIFSLSFSFAQEKVKIISGCGFSHKIETKTVYTFLPDKDASKKVSEIMKYTGLAKNFVIRAANVDNAEASIDVFGNRLILYNQIFMEKVKNGANNNWAVLGILAHEIGHHLNGHTVDGIGSRPKKELEADKFIGFILYNMGATLNEAISCFNTFPKQAGGKTINGSYIITHPAKSARIAAISSGWHQAKDLFSANNQKNIPNDIPLTDYDNSDIYEPISLPPIIETESEEEIKKVAKYAKAKFKHIKLEHNQKVGFLNGMYLHFYLAVDNAKDRDIAIKVHIYNKKNYLFTITSHTTPTYWNSFWKDYKIFIPYNNINLPRNINHKMKLFIRTEYKGKIIDESNWYKFNINFK